LTQHGGGGDYGVRGSLPALLAQQTTRGTMNGEQVPSGRLAKFSTPLDCLTRGNFPDYRQGLRLFSQSSKAGLVVKPSLSVTIQGILEQIGPPGSLARVHHTTRGDGRCGDGPRGAGGKQITFGQLRYTAALGTFDQAPNSPKTAPADGIDPGDRLVSGQKNPSDPGKRTEKPTTLGLCCPPGDPHPFPFLPVR